ncbi:recombinase family protein [Streptomyces avermitilis]|uniref:recombinase family protein n=1 Tax=Streptomyces avermitilis TaxID=33903 RepID=UPI0033E4CBBD
MKVNTTPSRARSGAGHRERRVPAERLRAWLPSGTAGSPPQPTWWPVRQPWLYRGIGFTSLHENLDTTTPGGRLVFHVFAALAEFIRELIVIGTNEGLAAARARGRVGGRPSVATEEIIRAARDLLPDPGRSITSIAKLLGVSPGTLYNHIPDLRELRAGGVPRQLEARTK